jgi:hypothetical protein
MKGMDTSVLRCMRSIDAALLVEVAVLALAQAVELLIVVGEEALFDLPRVAVGRKGVTVMFGGGLLAFLEQLGAVAWRG